MTPELIERLVIDGRQYFSGNPLALMPADRQPPFFLAPRQRLIPVGGIMDVQLLVGPWDADHGRMGIHPVVNDKYIADVDATTVGFADLLLYVISFRVQQKMCVRNIVVAPAC